MLSGHITYTNTRIGTCYKYQLALEINQCFLYPLPFRESQNGRGWKGPLWVTQSNPPAKAGSPTAGCTGPCQAGLEYLQRRRLYNLPGQPGPGLHHPQREEVLPPVQLELPLLQFVPIAPCPVAGHHWKELGPILLTPTLQIFISMPHWPLQAQHGAPCPSAPEATFLGRPAPKAGAQPRQRSSEGGRGRAAPHARPSPVPTSQPSTAALSTS